MEVGRATVAEIGEFPLIDRIRKILPPAGSGEVLVDMGDDTAVIRLDERRALLLTCDIQVEGRHFRLDRITPYQLGLRAMAANLSDIASMGGAPTYALVSLGVPGSFPVDRFDKLFEGMRDALSPHRAWIVGGNLARTEDVLVVDITLLGEADPARVLTRAGARPGDRVFVTGTLGASGAGLEVLRAFGTAYPAQFEEMVRRHLSPTARVELGQRIARSGLATAMIDLSDGAASDLFHVCTRSGVGAEIREDRLPLPAHMGEIAQRCGRSTTDLALHSGEDYELLCTVPAAVPEEEVRSLAEGSDVSITAIGTITERSEGYRLVDSRGNRTALAPAGWDHFRAPGRAGT